MTGDNNSPWKIRVTVSAEPGSDNSYERPVAMTRRVPLRGVDDEGDDFIRGRGVGRELATSPVRGKARGGRKRSATPARKGNARTRKSLTDLDITVLGDDSDDAATKPRRRSSRVGKKASRKKDEAVNKEAENRSAAFQIAEDNHCEPGGDEIPAVEIGDESVILQQRDPNTQSIPLSTPSKKRNAADRLGPSDRVGTTTSYPTPSLSPGPDGIQEVPSRDPTEDHAEFDSILESEGFTMISLESIPSAKQFISSPPELPPMHHGSPEKTVEEESDISSTVPDTSPPVPPRAPFNTLSSTLSLPAQVTQRRRANRTPEPPRLSPSLPSPPAPKGAEGGQRRQPAAVDVEQKPTPPGLSRVRKVGRELQGVVASPEGKKKSTPNEKLDGLFARGSSTGGMRLGDELAVKRRGGDVSSPAVRNTRPVTPVRDLPRQLTTDTREREWQLEREAVSRQIQMANTSQVIVIDSDDEDDNQVKEADHDDVNDAVDDDEDEDEDEEDVWLQEAHNSSQHSVSNSTTDSSPHLPAMRATQLQYRRGTIPSPWKRGEDVDQSTYLSNGDMSGIFWQQPTANKPVSSGLKILQRESPAKGLDMRKLLGVKETPQKLELETDDPGAGEPVDESSHVENEAVNEKEYEEDAKAPMLDENVDGTMEDEEEASSIPEMDKEILNNEEGVQGEPSSAANSDAESLATEERTINEQSIPTSEHDAEAETSIGSTAASSEEVSQIAPVKIPVNFGDESSLTRDHETSIASKSSAEHAEIESQSQCVTPEAHSKTTGSSWLGRLSMFRSPWGKAEEPATTSTPVESEEPFSSPGAKSEEQSTAPTSVQSEEPSMNSTTAQIEAQLMNSIIRRVDEVSIVSLPPGSEEASMHSPSIAQDQEAPMSSPTADSDGLGDEEGIYQPMSKIAFSAREPELRKEAVAPGTPSAESECPQLVAKQTIVQVRGSWTKDHYRALHRLYLKSLQRDAPRVRNIRPELMTFLNETAMSGTGRHEHRVTMTQKELAVVEDFMRSLEHNAPEQRLAWTAEDLIMRLYSIIAGYKARGRVPVV